MIIKITRSIVLLVSSGAQHSLARRRIREQCDYSHLDVLITEVPHEIQAFAAVIHIHLAFGYEN